MCRVYALRNRADHLLLRANMLKSTRSFLFITALVIPTAPAHAQTFQPATLLRVGGAGRSAYVLNGLGMVALAFEQRCSIGVPVRPSRLDRSAEFTARTTAALNLVTRLTQMGC